MKRCGFKKEIKRSVEFSTLVLNRGGFDCIICIAKYTLYSQHLKSGQKIQGNPGKVFVNCHHKSSISSKLAGSRVQSCPPGHWYLTVQKTKHKLIDLVRPASQTRYTYIPPCLPARPGLLHCAAQTREKDTALFCPALFGGWRGRMIKYQKN